MSLFQHIRGLPVWCQGDFCITCQWRTSWCCWAEIIWSFTIYWKWMIFSSANTSVLFNAEAQAVWDLSWIILSYDLLLSVWHCTCAHLLIRLSSLMTNSYQHDTAHVHVFWYGTDYWKADPAGNEGHIRDEFVFQSAHIFNSILTFIACCRVEEIKDETQDECPQITRNC